MRLKLLSVFLVIQAISFTLWSTVFSDDTTIQADSNALAEEKISSTLELASAALTEVNTDISPVDAPLPTNEPNEFLLEDQAQGVTIPVEIPKSLYSPHFSAKNISEEQDLVQPIHEDQIKRALNQLPLAHAESVETVSLDYDPEAHRGLGGGSMIILRAVDMSTEEFLAVLVHETAHNVDYGFLTPSEQQSASGFIDGEDTLYETDPSLDFYRLSWYSNNQRQPELTELDFVSGYAMSDPFEDFAETYTYYVLHNKDFKALAATSDVLMAKYNFMKDVVFVGAEFDSGQGNPSFDQRPWDITVLPYDLDKFLL